jgi:hypothetical protein
MSNAIKVALIGGAATLLATLGTILVEWMKRPGVPTTSVSTTDDHSTKTIDDHSTKIGVVNLAAPALPATAPTIQAKRIKHHSPAAGVNQKADTIVNNIGQIGDTTNNYNAAPKPSVQTKELFRNQLGKDGLFHTKVEVTVISP